MRSKVKTLDREAQNFLDLAFTMIQRQRSIKQDHRKSQSGNFNENSKG